MTKEVYYAPPPMSQIHIAEEFAKRIAGKWYYVHEYKKWFFFDGTNWQPDSNSEIKRLVIALCRAAIYWPEAASLSIGMKRSICSYRFAGAVLSIASCLRTVAATSDKLGLPPKRKR